jgi:hypothetical protein
VNNALSKLLDYRAQRKRNSLVDGAQQHDALLGQPQRMGDGDDELSWLQKLGRVGSTDSTDSTDYSSNFTQGALSQPQRISNTNSVGGQFASGAAKEGGIAASTIGTSWLMDLAGTVNQLKHADFRGRKTYQPAKIHAVTGMPVSQVEKDYPIDFNTENWDRFEDIPGTTDFWAKKLGIPFEHTTPETVGRLVGGIFGMGAPLVPGTKAFVAGLRKFASTPSPMHGSKSSMRGNINYMDMPSFAEAFGDAADPGFFKASEGFRKGPSQFLVNPSENEIRTFFSRADMKDGGVRTTKDGDGNLYMWNAKEGTHKQFHIGVEDKFDKDMNWNQEYWNNHTERLYPEFEATEIAARNNPGVPALDTFDKRMAWVKGKPGRKLELQGRPRNQPIPNEMVNFLSDEAISSAGAVNRQGAAASGAAKDKAPAANALADDHDFLVALRDAQMRSLSYNADLMGDAARVPDKTITGYKLASRKKSQPGELYPGMLEANTPAFSRGEWQPARNEALAASRKNVAHRPGMHFIETPTADPTSTKGLSRARKNALDRVWVEAQFPDDTSEAWQRAAELSGDTTGGIAGEIPWGGNYLWNRPGQPMRIAGAQNITREVPLEEIAAIETRADDLVQGAVRKVKPDPELDPKPMTKAQAKAAGYPRDQRWHPISKNQLRRPLDQVERVVEDDGLGLMRPAVTISPEELQGGTLIPALGDRSDIGKNLSSVGGNALASPVRLEGGHGYMRQGDESVWASAEGKVSALNNKANEALEAGRDPYLVYVPMGHDPMDFNTMMTDATYELMKGGELSKTARNKFDRLMRQKRNLWPGIDSDEARTLLDGNGETRKAFMSIVGREEFRNLPGMPDVAELRYALTDPDLLDVPLGQGGQSIARASGTVVQDPKLPHSTYDQQMSGEYVGGFGKEGVPRDVMFPDFIKARRADPDDSGAGYDARSMELSLPTQEANQEWVDGMMAYLMSKGMTAAAAAAVLGAGTQGMQEEPTNALAGS